MIRRALLLVLLLASGMASANVSFGLLPQPEASPGEYLTFAVPVTGNGFFTVQATAPPQWQLVSASREVELSGTGLVPFTVRVPSSALAGTRAELHLSITGTAGSSSGSLTISVAGSSGLTMTEASQPRSAPGEVLSFTVRVTNSGNQPDVIELSAHNASQRVHVNPTQLHLGPFQSGEVNITVPVQGTVGNGYRLPVTIDAISTNTGYTASRRITATYLRETASEQMASPDPQLILKITAGVSTGLESTEGETTAFFAWKVQPGLSGELSDHVHLDVRTEAFRNTDSAFFSTPQHADIELAGRDWEAAASLGPSHLGLSGGLRTAGWRFSAGGHYRRMAEIGAFHLQASALSENPGLDLQFHGNLFLAADLHSESVSALWRRQVSDNLQFSLGMGLAGYGDTLNDYRLALTLNQNLQWLSQNFDLSQSLSSTPSLGLHSLSLTGGSRSADPFGIRFLARLNMTPRTSRLTSGVQFSSMPAEALRLSVGVFHETTDFGSGPSSVRLQTGASLRFHASRNASGTLGLSAESTIGLTGTARSGTAFRVKFDSSFRQLSLRLGASRESWLTPDDSEAELKLIFSAGTGISLGRGSDLEASLEVVRGTKPATTFSVRWQQSWNEQLQSSVAWRHQKSTHDFTLGVTATDVFTSGLGLGLGYALRLADGTATHRVSAGISYTWLIPFRTPTRVVNAFGGRETGGITGVARVDHNPGSSHERTREPLAGATIRVGEAKTVTAADGTFTLRSPPGRYTLAFDGLPATLGFTGDREVEIHQNSTLELDLDFVPVSVLRAVVFLDADRDGQRAAEEPGIQDVRLQFTGPRSDTALTDSDGNAWFSGLVQGSYTMTVDLGSLPAGFELTQELPALQINPPGSPAALLVPVAPRIREVITTFQTGRLVMNAWLSGASLPAGGEVTVYAQLQGEVESVKAELFDQLLELKQQGNLWSAAMAVPSTPGLAQGVVIAMGSDGQQAEAAIQVFVRMP